MGVDRSLPLIELAHAEQRNLLQPVIDDHLMGIVFDPALSGGPAPCFWERVRPGDRMREPRPAIADLVEQMTPASSMSSTTSEPA